MNFIFLIAIVFTEALVHGGQGVGPCQQRSHMTQYQQFVHRHILKEVFDRGSLQEWERWIITWNEIFPDAVDTLLLALVILMILQLCVNRHVSFWNSLPSKTWWAAGTFVDDCFTVWCQIHRNQCVTHNFQHLAITCFQTCVAWSSLAFSWLGCGPKQLTNNFWNNSFEVGTWSIWHKCEANSAGLV